MFRSERSPWSVTGLGALVAFGLLGLEAAEGHAAESEAPVLLAQADDDADQKSKKKRRKRRRRRKRSRRTRAAGSTKPQTTSKPASATTTSSLDARRSAADDTAERAARDRTKRVLEGRKGSRVTEGTASRWSNRGAMVPVATEVPITKPLPARAVPRPAGVQTVGQRLQGGEPLFSARMSLGYYHLETLNPVFQIVDPNVDPRNETRTDDSIAFDLLRARATLSYQRIARTEFGVQVDAEFRPQLQGQARNRPTDFRLNELFVSYGRTDWRRRRTGPSWGIALGRVAIREAGYAQADGLAARFRIIPEVMVGAWGGVTGNPYGFNWAQQQTEFFSTDWYSAGAFVSVLVDRLTINLAGGATIANLNADAQGADRVFVYVDSSYAVTRDLNILLNGWFDALPDGQSIQNVDLIVAYTPTPSLSFSLAGGRFSTVVYSVTEDQSNEQDPDADEVETLPVVGIDGQFVAPNDVTLLTAVYNSIRARAGYRIIPQLEAFIRWTTLLRDTSITNTQLADVTQGAEVEFSTVRSLPTIGVRYRDPKIIDANVGFTYVLDAEATSTNIVRGGIGRGYAGIYLSGDVRAFFGDISGYDGGVNLSYTLPRSWTPGAVTLRGSFRYYLEDVALAIPNAVDNPDLEQQIQPNQESFFGYAGIDWRY